MRLGDKAEPAGHVVYPSQQIRQTALALAQPLLGSMFAIYKSSDDGGDPHNWVIITYSS